MSLFCNKSEDLITIIEDVNAKIMESDNLMSNPMLNRVRINQLLGDSLRCQSKIIPIVEHAPSCMMTNVPIGNGEQSVPLYMWMQWAQNIIQQIENTIR